MSYKLKVQNQIIDKWLEGTPSSYAVAVKNILLENFDQIHQDGGVTTKIFNTDDIEEFAEWSTAREVSFEHSWAGSDYNTVEFITITGNISYGKDRHSEYSANGSTGSPDITIELVDFEETDSIVFLRHDYSSDSFSYENTVTVTTSWTLVFYNTKNESN